MPAMTHGDPDELARTAAEEIRHYLRGEPFANWADRARSFAAAQTLKPKRPENRRERRCF
jgi:hypothetical protein